MPALPGLILWVSVYLRIKGTLFWLSRAYGSIAAFGVGFFVKWVLDNEAWGFLNYGLLFTVSFVLFMASLVL